MKSIDIDECVQLLKNDGVQASREGDTLYMVMNNGTYTLHDIDLIYQSKRWISITTDTIDVMYHFGSQYMTVVTIR